LNREGKECDLVGEGKDEQKKREKSVAIEQIKGTSLIHVNLLTEQCRHRFESKRGEKASKEASGTKRGGKVGGEKTLLLKKERRSTNVSNFFFEGEREWQAVSNFARREKTS